MNILGIYGAIGWDPNTILPVENTAYQHVHVVTSPVHGSGATLISNGVHVSSISEERLANIKHCGNYPKLSIDYCLSAGNVSKEEIDVICISAIGVEEFYKKLHGREIERLIKKEFPNAEIKIISHHTCHAASAIFSSSFDECTFLTLDGMGSVAQGYRYLVPLFAETNTVGYFNQSQNIFNIFLGQNVTNNFGNFYALSSDIYLKKIKDANNTVSNIHYNLIEESPGKIMGLSAYGNSNNFNKNDCYALSKNDFEHIPYIDFNWLKFNSQSIIDAPQTETNNLAWTLQKSFESALYDYVEALVKHKYLRGNVCFAGGSFLNVLANSVIRDSGLIENIHIPPFTDDCGLHFGAAAWSAWKNNQEIKIPYNISLMGKEYSTSEIKQALAGCDKIEYAEYEFNELAEITAEHLQSNKIVAWFQGRSEFGPRALGSRSILMNPTPKENKDILNLRVKHREYWRPFAGIILEEHVGEYFVNSYSSPYMLYSNTVRDDKIEELAAITHVDKSCRIQTVTTEYNERMTILINKFHKLSGTPVVLNTSFNDNGQPIVESPIDALNTFINMDIDVLVIGNFLVTKNI